VLPPRTREVRGHADVLRHHSAPPAGGFLGRALFGTGLGDFFDLRTWVLALVGSLIVLGIYRLVTRRRTRI
jgi:hypothetical protein